MTEGLIREHAVTSVREQRIVIKSDAMQTHYVGAPDSEISLRIYDKSAEILHSQKHWFLPLWGLEECSDIWRFEFQIRRPMLKACQIHSLDDLLAKRGELWQYLTECRFSLRLHDNDNVTRRSVHPLWLALQQCAERFGPTAEPLQRIQSRPSIDSEPIVQQVAARVPGFAARERLTELDDTLQKLVERVRVEFRNRNFQEECHLKAIQLGISLTEEQR